MSGTINLDEIDDDINIMWETFYPLMTKWCNNYHNLNELHTLHALRDTFMPLMILWWMHHETNAQ